MIMAKWTVNQHDEKYEDEPGTKRPRDFLTVLYAEKYGEVQWTLNYPNPSGHSR